MTSTSAHLPLSSSAAARTLTIVSSYTFPAVNLPEALIFAYALPSTMLHASLELVGVMPFAASAFAVSCSDLPLTTVAPLSVSIVTFCVSVANCILMVAFFLLPSFAVAVKVTVPALHVGFFTVTVLPLIS